MAKEQEAPTVPTVEGQLENLLTSDDLSLALSRLDSIHPADQADLFTRLDQPRRSTMLSLLSGDGLARLLEYLDDEKRIQLIDEMPRASLARVLDRMENDEAVDIVQSLPASEAARVLSDMTTAVEITPLLSHAEESAGGLMTRGYVALHPEMTAEQAMTYLRLRKPFTEEGYYLYVLDEEDKIKGVVNLRELIVSAPRRHIKEVMTKDLITVLPGTDQEECARLLQRYKLKSLPVVDEKGILNGIITGDDLMEVAREEATEDMYRMAGLPADESVSAPWTVSVRRRFPWLLINLVTAFAAAGIVSAFEGTIERAAALAIFMPVVAGQGGNAGIQTITIVVRGIAVGEIQLRDVRYVLAKEIGIGVLKGIGFGILVGIIAWAWQDNWVLGLVVGVALLLNILIAGMLGALIPVALRALKLDPAIASGIFLTTFTDVLGLLFLLGIASLLITQLA